MLSRNLNVLGGAGNGARTRDLNLGKCLSPSRSAASELAETACIRSSAVISAQDWYTDWYTCAPAAPRRGRRWTEERGIGFHCPLLQPFVERRAMNACKPRTADDWKAG